MLSHFFYSDSFSYEASCGDIVGFEGIKSNAAAVRQAVDRLLDEGENIGKAYLFL